MPKKRSAANFLQSIAPKLRSGVLKSTAPEPLLFNSEANSKTTDRTETLPDLSVPPTQGVRLSRSGQLARWGHGIMVLCAIAAGGATLAQAETIVAWERQAQSLILQVRGPVTPPDSILILSIDDESLLQLSSSSWPLRRATYAKAIDKVMQAGAKAVAVGIRWDLPSSFGSGSSTEIEDGAPRTAETMAVSEDDRQLQAVLNRYDGRITLAVDFDQVGGRQQEMSRISLPFQPFQTPKASYGLIKFPLEPNDRVHRFGSAFAQSLNSPDEAALLRDQNVISFAEATLKAAQINVPAPQGDSIYFYGPAGTFPRISFWNVLWAQIWNDSYLQQGKIFKDKIVIIGPTASKVGDVVRSPFRDMPGVELHANAIASLLQQRSLRDALPTPTLAALAVAILVLGAGVLQSRSTLPSVRLGWALAIALSWGGVGYVLLTQFDLLVPIATPMIAIALSGVGYLGTGLATEYRSKRQFRKTLKHYAGSPLVQEIISQQDDLKDLLQERELEILGKQLSGRYKITKVLGSGGFGETYIAEDFQRPGSPQCVVKQLRPTSNNPKHLRLARRLFQVEAETLERLGEHDQIPRLLAYFEEDHEFYLVQEFISGNPLSEDLSIGRHLPEGRILQILQELLQILSFVHSRNVIHRDIKPSNIIKRHSDQRLVLIDFGAVKALRTQIQEGQTDSETPATATIGIGTQGYMPQEQCAGNPRFNSDIYAVGMIGIQALTGLPPSQLKEDPQTGEIAWQEKAIVTAPLAAILNKMVHYDFRKRYQSTIDALQDLMQLSEQLAQQESESGLPFGADAANFSGIPVGWDGLAIDSQFDDEFDDESTTINTQPWPATFATDELPPTELPPTEQG